MISMHIAQHSWIEQEFPAFDAGPDGFPRPGQVIRHFRQKKLKANGKPWTQRDLAHPFRVGNQPAAIQRQCAKYLCWYSTGAFRLGTY